MTTSIFNRLRRRDPQAARQLLTSAPQPTPRPPMPEAIDISMSAAFYNKRERDDIVSILPDDCTPVFSQSFRHMRVSPRKFAQTVCVGNAWSVAVFENEHRAKAQFISSQVLALDFDNAVSCTDLLQDAFTRQYAYLLYPSPSSTPEYSKSRAVFILDHPITDGKKWEKLQQALIDKYALYSADPQCKDCARFYYGSDVKQPYLLPRNVLPVSVMVDSAEYRIIEQRRIDAQRAREIRPTFDEVSDKAVNALIDTVARNLALEGSGGRNDSLFKATLYLQNKKREEGWVITDAQLEQALVSACRANGLANDDGMHSVEATIKSAMGRG